MAVARITQQWSEDCAVIVEVEADGQHPDLLDEMVTRCIQLWRATCEDDERATESDET